MTLNNKSFLEIKIIEELKIAMQNGNSIHQCDRNGFNLYYYAPIEMYPFLKK